MIITKAEEREDIGVTFGAIMAGILALVLTGMGTSLMLWLRWPAVANMIGLDQARLVYMMENLPMWLATIGAAMSYFILYVLVKRAARHDLKKRRAHELARVKLID